MKSTHEYEEHIIESMRSSGWEISGHLNTSDGMKYTIINPADGCVVITVINWGECTFYGSERDISTFDSSVYELRDEGILEKYKKHLEETEDRFNQNTPQEVVMNVLAEHAERKGLEAVESNFSILGSVAEDIAVILEGYMSKSIHVTE